MYDIRLSQSHQRRIGGRMTVRSSSPPYIDQHLHFSGALPLDFLWACYDASRQDDAVRACIATRFADSRTELQTVEELRQLLESTWSSDWRANVSSFFSTYAMVQQFTKAGRATDCERFYFRATTEIVSSQLRSGVDGGEIICGPSLDDAITNARIFGMCSALQSIQGHRFGLRLTFIRGSNGRFKNLSSGVIANLRATLRHPAVFEHMRGFDFSGEEHPHLVDETVDAIRAVSALSSVSCPDWNMSVHVGEDLRIEADIHLRTIEELVLSPISRICHGTFLWLPSRAMPISDSQLQARERLLEKMVDRGISLEICPSANLKMSPVTAASEIPIQLFDHLGLRWSIITDNPTLFGTTLRHEHEQLFAPA